MCCSNNDHEDDDVADLNYGYACQPKDIFKIRKITSIQVRIKTSRSRCTFIKPASNFKFKNYQTDLNLRVPYFNDFQFFIFCDVFNKMASTFM